MTLCTYIFVYLYLHICDLDVHDEDQLDDVDKRKTGGHEQSHPHCTLFNIVSNIYLVFAQHRVKYIFWNANRRTVTLCRKKNGYLMVMLTIGGASQPDHKHFVKNWSNFRLYKLVKICQFF